MMHLVKILYGLLPREKWPWTEHHHLRDNVIRLMINIHSDLDPYFGLLYSSLCLQVLDAFDLAMLSDRPNLPWWVTRPDALVILKLLHEIILCLLKFGWMLFEFFYRLKEGLALNCPPLVHFAMTGQGHEQEGSPGVHTEAWQWLASGKGSGHW